MKTKWDYTSLADAYLNRPDYAVTAIDAMLSIIGAKKDSKFCDVGAGVAHLTLMLAERDFEVIAIEPNDAMRNNGIERTKKFNNVKWHEGTGEITGQTDQSFIAVTFGSSFNVCDREQTLKETSRILKPGGWFACMWNHRQLEDPIQSHIEMIIKENISSYDYGSRREDQTEVINSSGLFGPVVQLSSQVFHSQTVLECIEAWRSHATLERQAKGEFKNIVNSIEVYLKSLGKQDIQVPYITKIWLAQRK